MATSKKNQLYEAIICRLKTIFKGSLVAVAVDTKGEYVYAAYSWENPWGDKGVSACGAMLFADEIENPHWLIQRANLVREEENISQFNCPAEMLEMLTPTTAEYAVHWRTRCARRAHLVKRVKMIYKSGRKLF